VNGKALDNQDAHQRQLRIAVGIAVSLALHGLLLATWRGKLPLTVEPPEPAPAIAVWLRPPPPPALPRQTAPPSPAHATPRARPHPRQPPRRVITALPQPESPSTTEAPVAHAPAPSAPPTPHFDRNAALAFARKIADDDADPAKAGTPLAQLPKRPLVPFSETRAARAIGKAWRPNCKDGVPGGLLAPLFLLLDKKDSGCKW
jgi:hypothetical protein